MTFIEFIEPFIIVAILAGLLSLYSLLALILSLRKLKLFAFCRQLTVLFMLLMITGSITLFMLGTQGYQALTQEELVANIEVTPTSEQTYYARLLFLDGTQQVYLLNGDELLVDAYILKWKPWANILGLHTAYRLERVSGRYQDIQQEQNKPRTVFALNSHAGGGLAEWRKNYQSLSFLVDVEHGSASFVSAQQAQQYQLLVSSSGLIIRPVKAVL
ncbi:hypothetical protein [Aliikangiella maris]|uniref:Cation/multidrug efflux pump n=2 Tax=Aliikangiella maris TaxID=3162458 RepID=A0ABV2BXE0_9GAMM